MVDFGATSGEENVKSMVDVLPVDGSMLGWGGLWGFRTRESWSRRQLEIEMPALLAVVFDSQSLW